MLESERQLSHATFSRKQTQTLSYGKTITTNELEEHINPYRRKREQEKKDWRGISWTRS